MPESTTSQEASPQPITTWQDPPATPPERCQQWRTEVADLQQRLVASGKVAQIDRALHQKQTWGGKGRLTVDADLAPELSQHILAGVAGRAFPAAIRFSNGQGCPNKDTAPDVRGLAVKVNIEGREVDLLAVSGINFARHTAQFMRFLHIMGMKQAEGGLKAVGELVKKITGGDYDAREVGRIAGRLGGAARRIPHLAGESYWTQPMKVGSLVGRFVFSPNGEDLSDKGLVGSLTDADYLRHTMEQDLEQHPVAFHVGFEAFTDETALRDASVHGNYVTYSVGELTMDARPRQSPERDQEERVVSKMAFNPANGFQLAGTMNEDRAQLYEESAKNRNAWAWDHPEIQAFFH